VVDIRGDTIGFGHRRIPQLPELAVTGGGTERVVMREGERLEAHSIPFEYGRFERDHW
jgi:hypothetical protein